jgi:hypothetical protein
MKPCRRFGPRVSTIRATDLAKMGYCEQRLVFEKRLGERLTGEQRAGIRRGNSAHDRFLRQSFAVNPSVGSSKAKTWCFVASAVYGPDAPETHRLREFRDTVLRPTAAGRWAIRFYYRVSPQLVQLLTVRPWALRAARAVLDAVVYRLDGKRLATATRLSIKESL